MTPYMPCKSSCPNDSTLWDFQSSTRAISSSSASSNRSRFTASLALCKTRSAASHPAMRSSLVSGSSVFLCRSWRQSQSISFPRLDGLSGAYLEEQRILDQALHGLEQKSIEGVEVGGNRMIRELDLVEDLVGDLRRLPLVRNERLINVEGVLVKAKGCPPTLDRLGHRVCRLDPDEEPTLKVEDGVNVEEYLVHNVARYCALLL